MILSDKDVELIHRLEASKIPDSAFNEFAVSFSPSLRFFLIQTLHRSYIFLFQPWVDWFTNEVMKTPLRKFPEHKRSFVPSKIEAKKVRF